MATTSPLTGEYTFTDADLSTINGIGGTLSSTGTFKGQLTAINAIGQSQVPDFNLDLGGKPVPLTAQFDTLIDGTDGTTILNRVDAKLLNTKMVVSGAITEHRSDKADPVEHRAGDISREAGGISHYWINHGTEPAVLLSSDVFHGK